MHKPTSLFVLDSGAYNAVYAPAAADAIATRTRLLARPLTAQTLHREPGVLSDVELIFSGWGAPRMDQAFLDAAPRLRAVFYAAGAVGGWATPAVWNRGIVVTTANDANAIPVAEYTVAMALLALKYAFPLACEDRRTEGFRLRPEMPGNYGSTVGLVGCGTIGRLVARRLAAFDMRVLTYDPYLSDDDAKAIGVTRVPLDELFAASDVVSLHAPDVPATRGMIDGRLIGSMRPGATLINTSRGRVMRENELATTLSERPDLYAVLDVTEIEPLPDESPLRQLKNVTLTPHIAGSQGRECQRMGRYMVEELDRYLAGEPLQWQVRQSASANSVHQAAFGRILASPQKVTA